MTKGTLDESWPLIKTFAPTQKEFNQRNVKPRTHITTPHSGHIVIVVS